MQRRSCASSTGSTRTWRASADIYESDSFEDESSAACALLHHREADASRKMTPDSGSAGPSLHSGAFEILVEDIMSNHAKYRTYIKHSGPLTQSDCSFYNGRISRTRDQICDIALLTIDQNRCRQWYAERRLRLTASRAHSIKTRRCAFVDLAFLMLEERELYAGRGLRNVKYGLANEDIAKRTYAKRYGRLVFDCGLVIHPRQAFLAGSPDGLVHTSDGSMRVLEVKCPISCENKPIIDRYGHVNIDYIYRAKDDNLYLKETHRYYTQCQMLMYCTATSTCDFFIYSRFDDHLVTVYRDDTFLEQCVFKLEWFYFNHYLPSLN